MTTHLLLSVLVLSAAPGLSACASNSAQQQSAPASEPPAMKNYTGVLRSGYAGIGGESTGWMLKCSGLERPVEADVTKVIDIARQWEGMTVRVWGKFVTKKYVERGEVSIFVVERIDPVM